MEDTQKPLSPDRTSLLASPVSLNLSCTHIILFLFLSQTPILLIPCSILLTFISFHHSLQSAPSFRFSVFIVNKTNDPSDPPRCNSIKKNTGNMDVLLTVITRRFLYITWCLSPIRPPSVPLLFFYLLTCSFSFSSCVVPSIAMWVYYQSSCTSISAISFLLWVQSADEITGWIGFGVYDSQTKVSDIKTPSNIVEPF